MHHFDTNWLKSFGWFLNDLSVPYFWKPQWHSSLTAKIVSFCRMVQSKFAQVLQTPFSYFATFSNKCHFPFFTFPSTQGTFWHKFGQILFSSSWGIVCHTYVDYSSFAGVVFFLLLLVTTLVTNSCFALLLVMVDCGHDAFQFANNWNNFMQGSFYHKIGPIRIKISQDIVIFMF